MRTHVLHGGPLYQFLYSCVRKVYYRWIHIVHLPAVGVCVCSRFHSIAYQPTIGPLVVFSG